MLFNGLEGMPSLIYLFRCLWAAGLLNMFFQLVREYYKSYLGSHLTA